MQTEPTARSTPETAATAAEETPAPADEVNIPLIAPRLVNPRIQIDGVAGGDIPMHLARVPAAKCFGAYFQIQNEFEAALAQLDKPCKSEQARALLAALPEGQSYLSCQARLLEKPGQQTLLAAWFASDFLSDDDREQLGMTPKEIVEARKPLTKRRLGLMLTTASRVRGPCRSTRDAGIRSASRNVDAAMIFGLMELAPGQRSNCHPVRATALLDRILTETGARSSTMLYLALTNQSKLVRPE